MYTIRRMKASLGRAIGEAVGSWIQHYPASIALSLISVIGLPLLIYLAAGGEPVVGGGGSGPSSPKQGSLKKSRGKKHKGGAGGASGRQTAGQQTGEKGQERNGHAQAQAASQQERSHNPAPSQQDRGHNQPSSQQPGQEERGQVQSGQQTRSQNSPSSQSTPSQQSSKSGRTDERSTRGNGSASSAAEPYRIESSSQSTEDDGQDRRPLAERMHKERKTEVDDMIPQDERSDRFDRVIRLGGPPTAGVPRQQASTPSSPASVGDEWETVPTRTQGRGNGSVTSASSVGESSPHGSVISDGQSLRTKKQRQNDARAKARTDAKLAEEEDRLGRLKVHKLEMERHPNPVNPTFTASAALGNRFGNDSRIW